MFILYTIMLVVVLSLLPNLLYILFEKKKSGHIYFSACSFAIKELGEVADTHMQYCAFLLMTTKVPALCI